MTEMTARQESREVHPTVAKLDKLKPHLTELGMDPARFKRIVLNEVQRNRELLDCEPATLFAAVLLSAQLDLEPGPPLGLSWFIPRNEKGKRDKQVTWMLGYRGMVELARRSGVVVTVGSVYESDHFIEHGGTSPRIEHRPALNRTGQPVAWYAVGKLEDGRTVHRVLTKADVEQRRNAGSSANSPAWKNWYDAMARKTAIRALFSQLPMSAQSRDALAYDDTVLHLPGAGGDVSVLSTVRDDETEDGHELGGAAATAEQIIEIDNLARQCELDEDALKVKVAELYDGVSAVDDLTEDQAGDLIVKLQEVAP